MEFLDENLAIESKDVGNDKGIAHGKRILTV
jgi:hypothetical protein